MESDVRIALAMAEVAAYHRRRDAGDAEPVEQLLDNCGDLRDLVEPMLELSITLADSVASTHSGTTSESEAPALERFGHFRLQSRLGRGGWGTVHLAFDETLERRVALKQIRPENLDSTEARARFEREARAVSTLDHPNLCQVFYTGEEAGIPYLVMQYVEGETLKDKIRRAAAGESPLLATTKSRGPSPGVDPATSTGSGTPTKPDEITGVMRLIEKVALALHHAHENGLVHRDVKPGNIIIKQDGEPLVLDFGVVREEGADLSLTSSSQQLGTPLYMAPEQIVPAGRKVDRRTDVYALGATLYECLTLQVPFTGESRQELFQQVLNDEPLSVQRQNRAVPTDLAVIVAKALDKEPKRRYQSALELAEDLERVRRVQPIRARPAGPLLRLQRWVRRNPVAASLIVTITLGLAITVYLLGERNTAMSLATKSLDEFNLLWIGAKIDKLEASAERMHPARPDQVDALTAWCTKAAPLALDLPRVLAARDQLRLRAQPYTEEDRQNERADHPALRTLERQRSNRKTFADELAKYPQDTPSPEREQLQGRLEEAERRISEIEIEIATRSLYRFTDETDQFLHEALVEIAIRLERFLRPEKGLRDRVTERLEWARNLTARSIEDPALAWRAAIDAIAASEAYRGQRLTPQLGLVPIGADPESGLWEFHHLRSGAAPERDPETGRLRVTRETGIVFVLIPGGRFVMGAQKTDPSGPNYDPMALPMEVPVHQVTLDPFFLAKHEMTQAQWQRLTGKGNPSAFWALCIPKTRVITYANPVESVSWQACHELMWQHALSLPTEAQWEYACRADTSTPWWTGDERDSLLGTVNLLDRTAAAAVQVPTHWWDFDDGYFVHAPVDTMRPNPFGLHHMHSNVVEWCRDEGAPYTYGMAPGDGLREPTGNKPICRGTSFRGTFERARSAWRTVNAPTYLADFIGLRPGRPVED